MKDKLEMLIEHGKTLNAGMDQFNAEIGRIEQVIGRLNLGLHARVQHPTHVPQVLIGYGRVESHWGLFIFEKGEGERPDVMWPFGNAPRYYRTLMFELIPDLLDALIIVTMATTAKLSKKLVLAHEMADAITDAELTIRGTAGTPENVSKNR